MADKELVLKRTIFNALLCFNGANGEIQGTFKSGYSLRGHFTSK